MTFASAVSIKMSTLAENRLWNIYFPGLQTHDEMISFPWSLVLIGREADDLDQRLMTSMGQWPLCVGGWCREPGKMGLRAQRLAYIYFHPPWLLQPDIFFLSFTTQWPVFSCVSHELCKWLWNLFFLWPEEEKIEVREMPPPHFLSFAYAASEQPFMLAVWALVSALRPCERMMVAAELVEGEGQGTMTYTRNWGGRQGKNAVLVVGRLDID